MTTQPHTTQPHLAIAIPNPFALACLLLIAVGCDAAPGTTPRGADAGRPPPPAFFDAGPASGSGEPCDDGLDGDADGRIDEGCACTTGAVQPCFGGTASQRDVGICASGTQTCEGTDEFGAWGRCADATLPATEICGNGIDEDCDGSDAVCGGSDAGVPPTGDAGPGGSDAGTAADAGSADAGSGDGGTTEPLRVPIMFFGDCVTASCPPEAPYPVGCSVFFSPGDDRGCVAAVPTESTVYFQAGDQCNAGFVTGHLLCSTVPGDPLDSTNCPINKPEQIHVSDRSMCPETH